MLRPRLLLTETARLAESLEALCARLARTMAQTLAEAERRLKADAQLLESLSYENVLHRGYAAVREVGGPPLTHAAKATPGLGLEIQFQDGRVGARVEDGTAPRRPAQTRRRRPKPDDQGQLF